jgi:hypothetical protein
MGQAGAARDGYLAPTAGEGFGGGVFFIIPIRRRTNGRGSPALTLVLFAGLGLVLIGIGIHSLTRGPDCDGHTMSPGDTCTYTNTSTHAVTSVKSYDEERSDDRTTGWVELGLGTLSLLGSPFASARVQRNNERNARRALTAAARARAASAPLGPGGVPLGSAYANQIAQHVHGAGPTGVSPPSGYPPSSWPAAPPVPAPPGYGPPAATADPSLHHDA